MSEDRLRIAKRNAPEIFAGAGPKGGALPAPQTHAEPVALEGGVLTVLTYPTGTAVKIDQNEAAYRKALAQVGAHVDAIHTIDADLSLILLARAIAGLDERITELERRGAPASSERKVRERVIGILSSRGRRSERAGEQNDEGVHTDLVNLRAAVGEVQEAVVALAEALDERS